MKSKNFEINRPPHNVRCLIYFSDAMRGARVSSDSVAEGLLSGCNGDSSAVVCGNSFDGGTDSASDNPAHKIPHIILFGHGFAGHKDNKAAARFAERIISKHKDTALVAFDWPCHGTDVKKKMRLSDCETYIDIVTEEIRARFSPDIIDVYATSFGGYLFLKYISERGNPFRRLALRNPAVKIYDSMITKVISESDLEKLKKGEPVLAGFDRKIRINQGFLDELKEADITKRDFLTFADDILIVQGGKDEILEKGSVSDFADQNVIECVCVEKADHRFTDPKTMDEAIKHISEFFEL